ncbi:hypothetical protein PTSG_06848 [Salpingoeca rosetta]|uniref:Uncharacterized protein n=1 Tax=Salpingoeca rosetta (strain ATCC 50818 / BSB-021) TaxID=946362 RepID=F2UEZ5_SALR5|nr:uncharacterized protein PTSG_06848 [Salpingoeca rosetta]EGD75195.1 hypothetical protein PTSG_06848 [Salpingoeca rosetta]|eukprot:XP_004992248.1 hypothetical protein PTSG_06848 [Salpingoeca rosetta]
MRAHLGLSLHPVVVVLLALLLITTTLTLTLNHRAGVSAAAAAAPSSVADDGPAVVLEEDAAGAFHINTSDPLQHPVYINGVDVLAAARAQQHVIREQQNAVTSLAAKMEGRKAMIRALTAQTELLSKRLCAAGVVQPSIDTTTITGISVPGPDPNGLSKWSGGVLAPNGLIYAMPSNAESVLIIDPSTNTADSTTIPSVFLDDDTTMKTKWVGGVLADNGLIYGIPYSALSVLIIDPKTNTVDATTMAGLAPENDMKWSNGVLADNGLIYSVPYSSTAVLIIDPATNTTDTSTIAGFSIACCKWYMGVLASNGLIYAAPRNADAVLILNPATNTFDLTRIAGLGSGSDRWYDTVLGSNGLIYGIPLRADAVLIIDPATNTTDVTTMAGFDPSVSKWISGIRASNGLIYGLPVSTGAILVINTATNTMHTTTTTLPVTVDSLLPWVGGVFVSNVNGSSGLVYAMPHSADSVLIIDSGC